jgi:hypothetical protein
MQVKNQPFRERERFIFEQSGKLTKENKEHELWIIN